MKIIQLDEGQLVEGCLAGDRNSQKQLYERYYGTMMAVCMRYTNDREEARDVLHEGFIKIYKNLPGFQKGTNLGGWIRRVMVNTAIDHYRKAVKIPQALDITAASYELDRANDVVSEMSAQEILSIVQKLPPAYRTVFNLYVVEGYPHKDIGEMLGISEGTSKSNLAKARTKLQKMIIEARMGFQRNDTEQYA